MEFPARQVYSPASSLETLCRCSTSTSELLMSAVCGGQSRSIRAQPHTRALASSSSWAAGQRGPSGQLILSHGGGALSSMDPG